MGISMRIRDTASWMSIVHPATSVPREPLMVRITRSTGPEVQADTGGASHGAMPHWR